MAGPERVNGLVAQARGLLGVDIGISWHAEGDKRLLVSLLWQARGACTIVACQERQEAAGTLAEGSGSHCYGEQGACVPSRNEKGSKRLQRPLL